MFSAVLCFLAVWPLVTGFAAPTPSSKNKKIQFRAGTAADTLPIAVQMARQLMNPLGIQGDRFLVACNSQDDRLGWAQIRPLSRDELVQQETDDVMWDEFENDKTVQVPVGWQSLPWTPEYQKFAQQAAEKRNQRQAITREVQAETPTLYELASVWVKPAARHQGIGKELVRQVLQRHLQLNGPIESVYLLTLQTTTAWYHDNFGFDVVPQPYVPAQMAFEVQAGKVITGLIGAELVCMQGNSQAFADAIAGKSG